MQRSAALCALPALAALIVIASCSSQDGSPTTPVVPSFSNAPCSATGTLSLSSAQSAVVDCSNGGTTVTLAGNGASYLVVAQFATSLVPDTWVPYHVSSGNAASASLLPLTSAPLASRAIAARTSPSLLAQSLPAARLRSRQLAFDRMLRARAKQKTASGAWRPEASLAPSIAPSIARSIARSIAAPVLGTVRAFTVLANNEGTAYTHVGARLAYSGSSVLVYLDTLAAPNGFTSAQLQTFGQLFDQTLYPIDTAAFGSPSDIDGNGRVILLMTPAVNALTSTSDCLTQGYIAGFFDEEDLAGGTSDVNSNQGEIFYSVAPDPSGVSSCPHTTADVGASVPGTFLHELQHLISFSQHFVIRGGQPEYGWLDEGLSIVAEELGSVYYEQKCPGTACRSNPAQVFPDSSQGFIQDFLYDSYEYALLPDTASVTLHDDSDDGFSWRGGDWLLMRWLGDQAGSAVYKRLDQSSLTGVANIQAATGENFPALFANFGLSLYTDSLPGFPRTTVPTTERFASRNLRQLWGRLFATSGGSDIPLAFPVQLFAISADTTTSVMDPGTNSYYRLDTPANAATVSIQFSGPGGAALSSSLKPQLVVFRLPPGQ